MLRALTFAEYLNTESLSKAIQWCLDHNRVGPETSSFVELLDSDYRHRLEVADVIGEEVTLHLTPEQLERFGIAP